ncbi:MAG TPA: hypothetical protein VEP49_18660, partial [Acidimicrobiia bacterium]|nr:hypothetical protein [Acidimicrobiia bacterium]
TTGDVVRTAPIDIEGVPGGVDIAPTGQLPDASMLQVRAEVRGADVGWPRSWYPAFAGPTDRVLVLSVHNSSSGVVTGLRVVGSVGHDKTEGEPINQTLGAVPANTTRQFRVPFVIGAPVWGDYTVHGSIYGLAAPVNFSVPMSNEPWGIELAVPIFLLAVAQLLRRRERAQRRAEEAQAPASEEAEPALFPESSPSLGDYDLGAFGGPAYDRPRPEPTAAATAAGGELVDLGQHS